MSTPEILAIIGPGERATVRSVAIHPGETHADACRREDGRSARIKADLARKQAVTKAITLRLGSEQLRTLRNALRHEWQHLQPLVDQVSVDIARTPEGNPERQRLLDLHKRYREQQAATDEILLQLASI